ncbi:MAG: amino acid adenylation domain-containing protein, partial [bacterium]|nr:amino acid adenylation domain-containing protein [bacterium]
MRKHFPEELIIEANLNIKEQLYWLDKLGGDTPHCRFPRDYETPVSTDEHDAPQGTIPFTFPTAVCQKLEKVSKGSDYTCNLILSTSVFILLHFYSGSNDIIIGTPIYKQETEENLINHILPLRAVFEKEMQAKQLLLQVRQTITEAVDHLNYPMEILVERLGLYIGAGSEGFPLFDVAVVLENIHDKKDIASFEPGILFRFSRQSDGLSGALEYDSRFYRPGSTETICRHFPLVLEMVLEDSTRVIDHMQLLQAEERSRILMEFNDTAAAYPRESSIVELFVEQVEKNPLFPAVEGPLSGGGTGQLTYGRLYDESACLAELLVKKGLQKGDVVAIMLETSCDVLVGVMGILMAGGAYMPINPGYPDERKHFMFADSNAPFLITSPSVQAENIFKKHILYIEDLHKESTPRPPTSQTGKREDEMKKSFPAGGPGDLAYIIYTSGSTGRPKGVMVEHRSVTRLVKNTNYTSFRPDDKILQTGVLEFDASTFALWGTLLNGLTLCLIPGDHLINPALLKEAVIQSKVTIMFMTTPLFNRMVQEDIAVFSRLRYLLVGGDVLSPQHMAQVHETYHQLKLFSVYGPTENTTFSTFYPIGEPEPGSIPIGRPIANSSAHIMDGTDSLLPVGIIGELYVGGDGVARGYLNKPEMTADKFIPADILHAHSNDTSAASKKTGPSGPLNDESEANLMTAPGEAGRLYKTGDLTRWRSNGLIEFHGRRDQQVKIRGFRIEPGEIESKLLEHPGVGEALVMPRSPDATRGLQEKYLCAYIVAAGPDPAPTPEVLKEFLNDDLPAYMIPSYIVRLERIPLTTVGKIDRNALPAPETYSTGYAGPLPRTNTEEKLADIWVDVLAVEKKYLGID